MAHKISFCDVVKLDDELKMELLSWRNQPFVREKMFHRQPIKIEEHLNYLKAIEMDENRKVFIAFIDEEPFGVLQYMIAQNALEFGYYLIREKWLDSGLGAVLEYVLLETAFYHLGMELVYCRTLTENHKVVELHRKFGFDGRDSEIEIDNRKVAICYQSIKKEKWEEKREQIKKLIRYIVPVEYIGKMS